MSLLQAGKIYSFLQHYGEGLVADVPADLWLERVCPEGVHPAWIVGHLGNSAYRVVSLLGGTAPIDMNEWNNRFGFGSQPVDDPAAYPAWDELLRVWRQGHEDLIAILPQAREEQLAQPNENPRMKDALPTVGDFLTFVLTSHPGIHLGQLSTWRRIQGKPALF